MPFTSERDYHNREREPHSRQPPLAPNLTSWFNFEEKVFRLAVRIPSIILEQEKKKEKGLLKGDFQLVWQTNKRGKIFHLYRD